MLEEIAWELLGKARPFLLALVLYVVSLVIIASNFLRIKRKSISVGDFLIVLGLAFHLLGILAQASALRRLPLATFQETLAFISIAVVAVSFIFQKRFKDIQIMMPALVFSAVLLLIFESDPSYLMAGPVAAILQSNFWLGFHVFTVLCGYSAIVLSMIVSHIYGFMYVKERGNDPRLRFIEPIIFKTIKTGVFLLAAGIILGATWANNAWGRYWAWDSKETWSLACLLYYLSAVFSYLEKSIKGFGLMMSSVLGFLVLLTGYCVSNFYMSGLHRYVYPPGKIMLFFVTVFVILEMIFMSILICSRWVVRMQNK